MTARWALAAVSRTKEQTFLISYTQDVGLPGWFIKVQPCSYKFMGRVAIFTPGPKHDHSDVCLTFPWITILQQFSAQLLQCHTLEAVILHMACYQVTFGFTV